MSTVHEELKAISKVQVKASKDRLDSWKEIALYLRREVRTVQRWERSEGLPVRRIFHNRAGSVYAFVDELDLWLSNRSRPSQDFVRAGEKVRRTCISPQSAIVRTDAKLDFPRVAAREQRSTPESSSATGPGTNCARIQALARAKGVSAKAKPPRQMSLFVACHPIGGCRVRTISRVSLLGFRFDSCRETFTISIRLERNGWIVEYEELRN